jgi:hypothetical protein
MKYEGDNSTVYVNSKGDIWVKDHRYYDEDVRVYIPNKGGNVYIFKDGEQSCKIPKEEYDPYEYY